MNIGRYSLQRVTLSRQVDIDITRRRPGQSVQIIIQ